MTAAVTGRVPARELIAAVARGFTELPGRAGAAAVNGPIGWSGYDEARARARERTGETEAVVCGIGDAGGTEAVLIAFEFGFLGGSIGEATGERIENAFITARDLGLPVVSLIASGGSRMQEGMFALTQLQRIARQLVRLRAAGLAHLAVLAGPVTGGGWATLGAGADVRVALPGAQVGFAGSRIRPAGADPRAYSAEGQFAVGQVDEIVPARELGPAVARWLALLTRPAPGPVPPPAALREVPPPESGWQAVTTAREAGRPRAESYLAAYFAERAPLGGTDPGILCGFGLRDGRSVAYVAQCGTATTPAGFRAATRLVRLADRLSIPVLTLVDTPGAANDAEAERDGVGAAIADTITAVAGCRIPVTTLLVGEGGSGGAVALTSPGHTWVTPDSYYSVVAPELAVAILKRGPDQVPFTADELRLRPQDLAELGIARGIVSV
ncbi:carboxyl transferase domain-containing protein [Streptomyces litchfieldiae]|uniref:Acetyl-coenzyme A carboxylase carboxyl transferase subunits beta/alpha n=1 Tax=Streptomyces litchfieldiae TaxID=3075543 RepID=A0ABU2MZN8_9ACTN|nr:carboxyl transferase domain-containing protein [Streptomyces sp. DSM 44938]MDT0347117.1 carboxyl transferase domain-containing protein [Streptomyces sp. DSM 44938]